MGALPSPTRITPRIAPRPAATTLDPGPGADYQKLIELLTTFCRVPDGLGEIPRLSSEEAARIRACGFHARAGCCWRCPLLPADLVSWNPLLSHLSDEIDSTSRRGGGWNPNRAPGRRIREPFPLMKIEIRILALLRHPPDFSMRKRIVQQKMWRLSARFLNHILGRMIAQDRITLYKGVLYPYGGAEFRWIYRVPTSDQADQPARPRRAGRGKASGRSVQR